MKFDQNLEGMVWTGNEKMIPWSSQIARQGIMFYAAGKWHATGLDGREIELGWMNRSHKNTTITAVESGALMTQHLGDKVFIVEYDPKVDKLRRVFAEVESEDIANGNIKIFPGGYVTRRIIDKDFAEYKTTYLDYNVLLNTAGNAREWYPSREAIITREERKIRLRSLNGPIDVVRQSYFANYDDSRRDKKYIHDLLQDKNSPDLAMPWMNGLAVQDDDKIEMFNTNGDHVKIPCPSKSWLPYTGGIVTHEDSPGKSTFTFTPFTGKWAQVIIDGEIDIWAPYG